MKKSFVVLTLLLLAFAFTAVPGGGGMMPENVPVMEAALPAEAVCDAPPGAGRRAAVYSHVRAGGLWTGTAVREALPLRGA